MPKPKPKPESTPEQQNLTVGVISDTHGLMRPEALAALDGSDLILHGGDIGKPAVLDALREVAPVEAIRGNVDTGDWAQVVPWRRNLELAGMSVHLLHNIAELEPRDVESLDAVVFGHSHKPRNETLGGVLYFNPGSAGPRRFKLPVTVGKLYLRRGHLAGEIVALPV
ncbi:MAG: YfcE family phosphodiesterase [Alteromonadaceae bacterium]|nr:YfcE family phosphodiesterase [Alteromonadaceae bacterium]